jgi:response regulator RpfG family c-di-GMP phosphodiesterase
MTEGKRNRARSAPQAGGDAAVRPEITERVLAYFRKNASAMDSVDGIARFWVREDRSVVERGLADLHTRGFLDKRLIAGTEFYSLRRDLPQGPNANVARQSEATVAHAEAPGRILVVDDETSVRKFLVAALTEAGHNVAAAENGERAMEMFRADAPDLVVTDLMMPGLSGIDLLQVIKQQSPATEVIVVTAHATLDAAVKALRSGAYDLITKPLSDLESLYRVVGRALERRRLSAENRLLVENLQGRNVELKETVARLAAVNEIGKATTGLLDMDELFDALVRLVAQHLKARRASVLLTEPDSDTMRLVASVGITDQEALQSRVKVGQGIAGRVAATQAPLLVQDIDKSELKSLTMGGKYATASFMITPLMVSYPIRYQRKRVGVINVSDKHSGDPFTEQDLEFLSTLSSQVAVAIENARLVKEMEAGYLGALVGLIQAAEDAWPESRGHSQRVAELASSIGRAMGLPDQRLEVLVRAAVLHEVGRFAKRPGNGDRSSHRPDDRPKGGAAAPDAWTPAEVMAAERILAPIGSLRAVREVILHSTDWFDAAPIPFSADRPGPGIPVESRILSVCEDFVRQTAGNGHDPETTRKALEAVRKRSGRKHDPDVVEILCRLVGDAVGR